MKLRIVGSMTFFEEFVNAKKELEKKGYQVFLPEKDPMPEPIPIEQKLDAMRKFNDDLDWADALLVMNFSKGEKVNHIGANTLMEIGMAFNRKKKVYLLHPAPDYCKHELDVIGCIILKGDINRV